MTGWDGKFDLQLLSQCGSMYNCLSRSVPEIHWHVAGTLSKQATKPNLGTVSILRDAGSKHSALFLKTEVPHGVSPIS